MIEFGQKIVRDFYLGAPNLLYRLFYVDDEGRCKSVSPHSRRKINECCHSLFYDIERDMDRVLGKEIECKKCNMRFVLKLSTGRFAR